MKIIDKHYIAFNETMKPIFVSSETVDKVKNNESINIRFHSDDEERKIMVNRYIEEYNKNVNT